MIPAASTATSVTSASPIISAEAVEAVRCGFRRALSRASTPAAPPNLRRRPAEHLRERPRDPRREQRDAEEDQQRAEAHVEEDLRRAEPAAEQPVGERGEAERR